MTKRQDEKQREATTYVVQETFGKKSDTYLIQKMVMGVEMDSYHVTIKFKGGKLRDEDVWCDCPGFRRQTYDRVKHKHVLLVIDYLLEQGKPKTATYTIIGTGKNAKIRFLRLSNE